MTKQTIKIYLEPEDYKRLMSKAADMGFEGKGAVSHYIEKISKEPVVFVDKNAQQIFRLMGRR